MGGALERVHISFCVAEGPEYELSGSLVQSFCQPCVQSGFPHLAVHMIWRFAI